MDAADALPYFQLNGNPPPANDIFQPREYMPPSYERLGFTTTGTTLSATLASDFITIGETAAFFNFLNDAFADSLATELPGALGNEARSEVTTDVRIASGSIKAVMEVITSREFLSDIASSLAASIIVAAATAAWPGNVAVSSNVPPSTATYSVPIDARLTTLTETMNASRKAWTIELTTRDPHSLQEVRMVIKGNQDLLYEPAVLIQ